jgi:antitoxin (DNA-binding transcriptional repressor) of toxin-antitoxin stability system
MILTATEFKAKCLQILNLVNETGESIQITKRGKVIAEVGPPGAPHGFGKAGFASGMMEITGDILEPLDVEWDALQ